MGERKSRASRHDKFGNSNNYDHSRYAYTPDAEVIPMPEGYEAPAYAPGGWATVNPEAVPEVEDSVDVSSEGASPVTEAPAVATVEAATAIPSNRAQLGEDISDLIQVGRTGKTFHRSDHSGKMLSTHEMELIAEHAELILNNSPEKPVVEPIKPAEPGEPIEPVAPVAPHETTDEEAAAAYNRLAEALGLNGEDDDDEEVTPPAVVEPSAVELQQSSARERVNTRLIETRERYSALTAQTRNNMWGRFLSSDNGLSRLLRRIPGVASLADHMNNTAGARELEQARADYMNTLTMQRKLVVAEAKQAGLSDEIIMEGMTIGLAHEDEIFEGRLVAARAEASKPTNRFVNWWARQEGWSGNAKKAAVALGGGLLIGAAVGSGLGAVFGAGIATGMFGGIAGISGATAAGASGVGMSRFITNRRANALTGGEGSQTVAQRDSARDLAAKEASLNRLATTEKPDADAMIRSSVQETELATDRTVLRNRRRTRRIGSLAFSAGGLAATNMANIVGDAMHSTGLNQANVHPNEGELPNDRYADVDKLHEAFNVESGHGFIKEWMDWGQVNGHPISNGTANQLHQAIREQFGDSNILDLSHVKKAAETYVQNGDLRIGAPGQAEWRKGVVEFAQQWLQTHNKW